MLFHVYNLCSTRLQDVRTTSVSTSRIEDVQVHMRDDLVTVKDDLATVSLKVENLTQAAELEKMQRQVQGLEDRHTATWEILQVLVREKHHADSSME